MNDVITLTEALIHLTLFTTIESTYEQILGTQKVFKKKIKKKELCRHFSGFEIDIDDFKEPKLTLMHSKF